jgi:hypothetical protein
MIEKQQTQTLINVIAFENVNQRSPVTPAAASPRPDVARKSRAFALPGVLVQKPGYAQAIARGRTGDLVSAGHPVRAAAVIHPGG